jgi:hypothetical protein
MTNKYFIITLAIFLLFLPIVSASFQNNYPQINRNMVLDYDPLVDINITIDIIEIRAIDKIDVGSDPDFYMKIYIFDEEFHSPIWNESAKLINCWTVTKNIPDDIEFVNITIQLWDWNSYFPKPCDISRENNDLESGYEVKLRYDVKTGYWYGDDYMMDPSGFGRLNGCDDGSIDKNEFDCEIFFDIYQNDYDNDGIPYWTEVNAYGTNPEQSDIGLDSDNDDISIEWEHKWGFHPFIWNDHGTLDHDQDSLTNLEEYLCSLWGTDPFRKDVLIEIDYMDEGPNGELSMVPEETYYLLKRPFHKRNIVIHIDSMIDGGDIIPFKNYTSHDEVLNYYNIYFMNNNTSNWRRSVFHYGVFVYLCKPNGYGFIGEGKPFSGFGYGPGTNSFVIASKNMYRLSDKTGKTPAYIYASSIMHEMGHNFGIRNGNPPGCDAHRAIKPWQPLFWVYLNYKSIMNYIYTYSILDYSDGSHGRRDHDDWNAIDLSHFEPRGNKIIL